MGSAVEQFTSPAHLASLFPGVALNWLGLQNLANVTQNSDPMSVLLQFAGLTVDNLKSMVVQALGANSAVAANVVAKLFDGVPDNLQGLQQVFNNINTEYGQATDNLNLQKIETTIQNTLISKLETAAVQAIASLAAKFIPGAGQILSIYSGFRFLLSEENQNQMSAVVQNFLSTLDSLASGNSNAFASRMVTAIDNSLPLLLQFAAAQLGLGGLRQQIQSAAQAIPLTIQAQLTRMITVIATNIPLSGLGASGTNVFAGQVAPMATFVYQGVKYDLWVAKAGSQAVVKLAVDSTHVLVGTISGQNLSGSAAATYGTLHTDAGRLVTILASVQAASTTKGQGLPNQKNLPSQQTLENTVAGEVKQLAAECAEPGQCGLFTGCFRADVLMLTTTGWKRVDEIRNGEMVASRDENDPDGPIIWKAAEDRFVRTGRILELLANGEEIGTTPEHPFFVNGKGWTEAGALHAGDEVRTRDGWVIIDEIRDTGLYEKVYNVRVAGFHTYFVGGDGCAVWAHNSICGGGELSAADLAVLFDRLVNGNKTVVLSPNKKYTIAGDTGSYLTNKDGQLSKVSFTITNTTPTSGRNDANITGPVGKKGQSGDVGFHIIGAQFFGSSYYPNVIPANSALNAYNSGAYGQLEALWKEAVSQYSVSVSNITVSLLGYSNSTSLRPTKFNVTFTINGKVFDVQFPNAPATLSVDQIDHIEDAIA